MNLRDLLAMVQLLYAAWIGTKPQLNCSNNSNVDSVGSWFNWLSLTIVFVDVLIFVLSISCFQLISITFKGLFLKTSYNLYISTYIISTYHSLFHLCNPPAWYWRKSILSIRVHCSGSKLHSSRSQLSLYWQWYGFSGFWFWIFSSAWSH